MENTMGWYMMDVSENMKAKPGVHETANTITTDIIKTVTFRAVRIASAC